MLHERGSSHGLTRIIRLAYHEHPSYVPLLRRSYELWHELEALAGRAAADHHRQHRGRSRGRADLPRIAGGRAAARPAARGARSGRAASPLPRLRGLRRHHARRLPAGRWLPAGRAQPAGAPEPGHRPRRRAPLPRAAARAWEATADGGVAVHTDRATYEADRLVLVRRAVGRQGRAPAGAAGASRSARCSPGSSHSAPELFAPDRFPVFLLDTEEGSHYGFPVHDVPGFKIGRYHHLREPMDPGRSGPLHPTGRRGDPARLRDAPLPGWRRADRHAEGLHLHQLTGRALRDRPAARCAAGQRRGRASAATATSSAAWWAR